MTIFFIVVSAATKLASRESSCIALLTSVDDADAELSLIARLDVQYAYDDADAGLSSVARVDVQYAFDDADAGLSSIARLD
ncbi:hypothetical protein ACJMK2_004614, partial [Sinanodonta woodiana]